MPVYGNSRRAEPNPLSCDLSPGKRLQLYEFELENDENEVPAKKFKKRKPRGKKKETAFFKNIGKNTLPPKPKKTLKKCVEEVPKRVLPKRGALRQILPLENSQSTSVLSAKSTGHCETDLMKCRKPVCPLSSSVSSFGGLSVSKNSDASITSNLAASALKQSSHSGLSFQDNFLNHYNEEGSKPPSSQGTLFHQISCGDFNDTVAESVVSNESIKNQSPVVHNFVMPTSVTVRNVRSRQKRTNLPLCSSPKPSKITVSSSPMSTKHIRCSSPNISNHPDRTLLFGATSPIKRQSSLLGSSASVGNENTPFNDSTYSNFKSFNSGLIAGSHNDTYKSAGEEDLCHYFGFEEEVEEKEKPLSNSGKNFPKKINNKKTNVKASEVKEAEKPSVDEVLSLLKSSVPADSDSPNPEPFSLSPVLWSPVKSSVDAESKDDVKKPPVKKRNNPRTKSVDDEQVLNILDDGEEPMAQAQNSRKESKHDLEKDKDEIVSISSSVKSSRNIRCRTKPKVTEGEKCDKNDEPVEVKGRKMNNVYKAPKRGKEASKGVKEKKEVEGSKKEMDEFEALAASLNSQFQEVENFSLAVE